MSMELTTLTPGGDTKEDPGLDNPGYVEDPTHNNNGVVIQIPVEEDGIHGNKCSRGVGVVQRKITSIYRKYRGCLGITLAFLFLAAYIAYFGYAIYYRFGDEGSYRLLGVTVFGAVVLLWSIGGSHVVRHVRRAYSRVVYRWGERRCGRSKTLLRWTLYLGMAVFVCVYTGVVIGRDHPRNLMSLVGISVFIVLTYITSTDPARVNWHPVFWGMSLQFVFACLILQTDWGFSAFSWLGDRMTEILGYSNKGAQFVFGEETYEHHMFAMKVLPVIVYFSSLISVLYYLGVMQAIIRVLGRFLAFCLDTTATESLNAAGNIFAGQTESPLMIRPFLPVMTKSEIHAVMTGGFATVSGSVLGAYVTYGVKANHLLSASVMSAPAALAVSKLTCPETEKSDVNPEDVYKLEMESTRNGIEAASNGASVAIKLVANVAVNVMAFLALLELVNASLQWCGQRVGLEDLSFQLICSYVFYPLSYVMGVDPVDCRRVAKLIGFKIFTNEFVAYIEMGKLIDNGHVFNNYTMTGGNWTVSGDDVYLTDLDKTLIGGFLLERTQVITTYALCGFSNLSSMGIQIGGLGAMAPTRKSDLTALALRAMVAGNVACFLTACIAGLFYSTER